jgi:hypothetical protein
MGRRVGGRTSGPDPAPDVPARLHIEIRFAPCSGTSSSVAQGAWHIADAVIETDDPAVLERIHEGRALSIDAKSIRRDDTELTHVRRQRLAQLQAIALLADGERPWYADARIVRPRTDAPPRRRSAVRHSRRGRHARHHPAHIRERDRRRAMTCTPCRF